jgi:HEAT repeat protein
VPAGAKAAAIEALSASADYSLVPLIASLALSSRSDDPALPRYVRALGAFGHPAGEKAVKRGLSSPSWEVRAAGAEAAGKIGLVTLGLHLRELLADPEWWVRFRAGEALAQMGPEGARLLREAAQHAPEPGRSAALLTMAERGIT